MFFTKHLYFLPYLLTKAENGSIFQSAITLRRLCIKMNKMEVFKVFKKFIALALASLMVVGALAGCGGNNTDNTATENTTTADGASENTGATGGTIKIGATGPLTGDTAVYGKAVQNGAQLAVDEINAAGGVNGYQLEFKMQDDENDVEKAATAYNALKDWGMQISLGSVTSKPCINVNSYASQDNMFLLTPSATAVESISTDNAFRVCFSDPNQGAKSAEYISQQGLATKIAVIYDSSDPYSSGIYNTFKAEAEKDGLEIVAAEAFTSDAKSDFSVHLQKAQSAGAELVFLPIYYQEASLILQQAKSKGYEPLFFGCDGLDGILAMDNFDTSLAEGVMLLTPFAADAQDEKTVTFVSAFKEKFNETPNQFAADAYDAIYAIKAALEKGNVTDPTMNYSDLCNILKVAMTEITVDGVTGTITWTADGEPNKEPKGMIIEDGAYKAM